MARYIDADKVIEAIKNYGHGAIEDGYKMLDPVDDIVMICGLIDYIPTADVAPRAEVAREIFEEIEKTLNRKIARSRSRFEKLHRDEKDLSIWGYKDMGYFQGIIATCEDLQDLIDELKKK